MSETIRFECPLPPRGLRRNSLALRRDSQKQTHGIRAKLAREYQEQVWCAGHMVGPSSLGHLTVALPGFWQDDLPWERAALLLTWRHAGVAPDEDNALASLKPLIDVLHSRGARPLSLVVDDSPAHLSIRCVTEKVRSRKEEGVVVELTRL